MWLPSSDLCSNAFPQWRFAWPLLPVLVCPSIAIMFSFSAKSAVAKCVPALISDCSALAAEPYGKPVLEAFWKSCMPQLPSQSQAKFPWPSTHASVTGPAGGGVAASPVLAGNAEEPCSFCSSPDVPVPYSALPCKHRSALMPAIGVLIPISCPAGLTLADACNLDDEDASRTAPRPIRAQDGT